MSHKTPTSLKEYGDKRAATPTQAEAEDSKREDMIALTLKKLEIIQRHKQNVQDACDLLGRRLIERAENEGQIEFGIQVILQGYSHDLSKFDLFEREYLIANEDKETLKLAILREYIKDTLIPQYDIPTGGKAYKTIKEFVDLLLENEFVKLK